MSDIARICEPLKSKNVEIFADEDAYRALEGNYPSELLHHALPEHFGTEYMSLKMSIRTVRNIDEALDHIEKYSSKHSEAIISKDARNVQLFYQKVDAACVYSNTSTAWTDGAQFGLGAEIGISTQKMHARGPMALEELTTYKWIISGNGQVRS